MYTRFSFTIDKNKLDQLPTFANSFTKRDGTQVNELNIRLDFVPLKEGPQKIRDLQDSTMMKVGFIAEPTTKADRDAGKKGSILGDAIVFEPIGQGVNLPDPGSRIPF